MYQQTCTWLDIFLIVISTCAFYFLANYHTYVIGSSLGKQQPLKDTLHDILPDLSAHVVWRDYILPLFFIPFLFIKNKTQIIKLFIEGFMYLITLKAITIFFTFIPSSNSKCAEKKQLNHCYHQMFSGHNSVVVLLLLLFLYYTPWTNYMILFIIAVILYSLLILATRAHYTVDILVSYIIVYLLV